jgi:hypothetical protein
MAMTRVKFLVFALAVVGLWVANLSFVGPALSKRVVEQTTKQLAGAPGAVALKLESRRADLLRGLAKVAGSQVVLAALKPGPKPEALSPEKLAPVKAAVAAALPEALRASLIVGIANDASSIWAKGEQADSSESGVLDLAKLGPAAADGVVQTAFGDSYLFYSAQVFVPEKADWKSMGMVLVGVPVMPEGVAEAVATELRLGAVGIMAEGKLLQSAGPDKASLEKVEKAVKLGQSGVASSGNLGVVGPFTLPMTNAGELMGGSSPLTVGLNQVVSTNATYSVVASASLTPFMQTLADYQKSAVLALAGLLSLAVGFTLIMGGKKAKSELELDDEDEPKRKAVVAPAPAPTRAAKEAEAATAALAMHDSPPAPEASPDDFHFGPPPSAAPAPAPAAPAPSAPPPEPMLQFEDRSPDPFATAANPAATPFDEPAQAQGAHAPSGDFEAPFPPQPAFSPFDEPEPAPVPPAPPVRQPPPPAAKAPAPARALPPEPKTRPMPAYRDPVKPAAPPEADPFAMAAAQSAPAPQQDFGGGDYNPDATRVATIPQELLQASQRGQKENPMVAAPRIASPLPRVPAVAMQTSVVSAEDQHYHEVYRDFVATREKCGEAADGLTYDKFSQKLKKNREQLMAKHACRTVRFQVYVKEGKAALKATPIKD